MTARPQQPTLTHLELRGYRAFRGPVALGLAPLTFIVGKNNAGKSALCFAPVFFTAGLAPGASAPFPIAASGVDFGAFRRVVFQQQATGLSGRLTIAHAPGLRTLELGATYVPEERDRVVITKFTATGDDGATVTAPALSDWESVRPLVAGTPAPQVASGVHALVAGRRPPDRELPFPAGRPERFDDPLLDAAATLFLADDDERRRVGTWFQEHLDVELRVDKRKSGFAIEARGSSGEWVNLRDSGAGLAQVLPLVVALQLNAIQPTVWCVEQPELHLHPEAHLAVADLLVDAVHRWPGVRILVETHSETVLLRVRRRIAEGERIHARDVGVYYVDPAAQEPLHLVHFNDDGTPDWWPKGVFAEPQEEFFAMRRAVRAREKPS